MLVYNKDDGYFFLPSKKILFFQKIFVGYKIKTFFLHLIDRIEE